MNKFLIILVTLLTVMPTYAQDATTTLPPDDLRSLIGKTIHLSADSVGYEWYSVITGVSNHPSENGPAVLVYFHPLSVEGYEVHEVVYSLTEINPGWKFNWSRGHSPDTRAMLPVTVAFE